MNIELQKVHFMPKLMKQGVLYLSEEYNTAAHLCACGCGSKIRTPLGPTEWMIETINNKPSLYPSIGNWQLPCGSHYWIKNGRVIWAEKWSPARIKAGYLGDEKRRRKHYSLWNKHSWNFGKINEQIKKIFSRR